MTIDTDPLGGEAAGRSRLVLRQGAWAIADQLLSSGTNFVMAVMVARLLAPKAYGSFVLATSAWLTLLSVVRAAVIHPFVVEAAQQDEAIFRQAASEASGVVVAVGVLGAALLAGVGVALGARTESGQAFVILGILTPFLVLQDFWRFTAFARGRARTAVANDGVWALVQTVCILLLIEASTRSPAAAVAAWGTGAVAGAFLGMVQFRIRPSFGPSTWAWARRIAPFAGWFGLSSGIYAGANQVVAVVVAASAGPAALGGLRALQTLLGPAQLVAVAGDSVALPAASRQYGHHSFRGLTAFMTRYAGLLTAVLGVYGTVVFIYRTGIIRLVLGPAFLPYSNLMLPLALGLAATACSYSGTVGLRSVFAGRALAQAELLASVVQVVAVGVLVERYGVLGAAWGSTIASAVHSASMWGTYGFLTRESRGAHRRSRRRHRRRRRWYRPPASAQSTSSTGSRPQ